MENKFLCVIGIDPGSSGGVAWNEPGKGIQAMAFSKFKTPDEQAANLRMTVRGIRAMCVASELDLEMVCYCELVTGFIPVKKQNEDNNFSLEGSAYRMFNFGKNYGYVLGIMRGLGVKLIEVSPRVWQQNFAPTKGLERSKKKAALKEVAQRIHGGLKVTLGTADALLIRKAGEQWQAAGVSLPKELPKAAQAGRQGARHKGFVGLAKYKTIDYRKKTGPGIAAVMEKLSGMDFPDNGN